MAGGQETGREKNASFQSSSLEVIETFLPEMQFCVKPPGLENSGNTHFQSEC